MKRKNFFVLSAVPFILLLFFLVFPDFLGNLSGSAVMQSGSRATIDPGIVVVYDTFDGDTTDFLFLNDAELAILENVTIENTAYGKIVFTETVNLTEDVDPENMVDIDKYISITYNRIEINTTALLSLKKAAKIYLYNLTFSNPRILKDGAACPSSVCQIISYSQATGTLIFNVTQFSVYEAEETPSAAPTTTATGGGGGAGREVYRANVTGEEAPLPSLIVNRNNIKTSIVQGEARSEPLKIINTGEAILNVNVLKSGLQNMAVVSENAFVLGKGESRTITIDFFAEEDLVPDIYTGKIIVKANGLTWILNVILEVNAKKPLFTLSSKALREANPGGDIYSNISIVNIGALKGANIILNYEIRDIEGNVIESREESMVIDERLELTRSLPIPANLAEGQYIFFVRVLWNGVDVISSDRFNVIRPVVEEEPAVIEKPATLPILIAILFGMIIVVLIVGSLAKLRGREKSIPVAREHERIREVVKEKAKAEPVKILEKTEPSHYSIEIAYVDPKVKPGQEVNAKIQVTNQGPRNVKIWCDYSIKTLNAGTIVEKQQVLSIDQKQAVRLTMTVPKKTPEGKYIFYAKIYLAHHSADASKEFDVEK